MRKSSLSEVQIKHVVTRTIMHYGPKRIAAALALIAVITFISFAVRNYFQQPKQLCAEDDQIRII